MKYKEKIKQMSDIELLLESVEKVRNGNLFCIQMLLLCASYWLTKQWLVLSTTFLILSLIPMTFALIYMVKYEMVDKEMDRRIKENDDKSK